MTMDAATVTTWIAETDQEIALLNRVRGLLIELLDTFPAPAVATQPVIRQSKPETPKPATPKRGGSSAIDYEEVARVILRAQGAGKPVYGAVAEHFDKPISTVTNWVQVCRKLGLLRVPPSTARTLPALPAQRPTFSTDDARNLIEGNVA